MLSITRRSSSPFRSNLILLAFSAFLAVAPTSAASAGEWGAKANGSFWSPVAIAWNWVLETVFAPGAWVLDPDGRELAPDVESAEPTGDATLEGPTA